jgi:hypothetical protein
VRRQHEFVPPPDINPEHDQLAYSGPSMRAVPTSFERLTWCRLPLTRPVSRIDGTNRPTALWSITWVLPLFQLNLVPPQRRYANMRISNDLRLDFPRTQET